MYAVIEYKWRQHIVNEWSTITVDNTWIEEWQEVNIDTVLAFFDENWKDVKLWYPYVKGWTVKAKVTENKKGEKIDVFKFKNKERYHKKHGFRPYLSVLQIEKLNHND